MTVVSVSGACLSSLLFKLKNVPGDADGFLLGKVCSLQVKNITDSQSTGLREERKICLHSFIHCNTSHSFYSRVGDPNFTKIKEILGDKYSDIVGWFSYRRNSSHRVSMRERVVHSRLAQCFHHLQNHDFLLGLITEKLVDMSTVHSTEYSFQYWDGRKFGVIESEMLTLPSSIPYQQLPTRLLPPHLTHYNTALKDQRSKFISDGDVMHSKAMEDLCTTMLQKLKPLEEELVATSEDLKRARNEVLLLRESVGVAIREKENSVECHSHLLDNPVKPVPNDVSACILIDIDNNLTESHDPSCDVSHDHSHMLTPSLDLLCSDVGGDVDEDSLVPSTQHSNIHKQNNNSLQYLSQELF